MLETSTAVHSDEPKLTTVEVDELMAEVQKSLDEMFGEHARAAAEAAVKGLEGKAVVTSVFDDIQIGKGGLSPDEARAAYFTIDDFDSKEQSFVCTCFVHDGRSINFKHIKDCGQLSWDRGVDDTQVLLRGPQYTAVVAWRFENAGRKAQGLAQVKSDDPVRLANEQVKAAASNPLLVTSVSIPENTVPPYERPDCYPASTRFFLTTPGIPWYKTQGFKWYKEFGIFVFLAVAGVVLKVASVFGWKSKNAIPRRVMLSKQEVNARLRDYTSDPHISREDRQYIDSVVIGARLNTAEISTQRFQDILRKTNGQDRFSKRLVECK